MNINSFLLPLKKFASWMCVKRDIHESNHKPPLFKEGEVWWCYIGENIGVEINVKGEKFTRPMLIFRKYDRYSFLGLPLSTKQKIGTWFVRICLSGMAQTVTLAQSRVFDYRRLKEKKGELEESEFNKIIEGYLKLHGNMLKNRPPAVASGSRG